MSKLDMKYTKEEWIILRDMTDDRAWKHLFASCNAAHIKSQLKRWRHDFDIRKRKSMFNFYNTLLKVIFGPLEELPPEQNNLYNLIRDIVKWRYTIGK